MFRQRKDIPVWIFEPRDFVATRRCPNPGSILFKKVVPFKNDSFAIKAGHYLVNILNFPTQNRECGRFEIGNLCDPYPGSVRIEF